MTNNEIAHDTLATTKSALYLHFGKGSLITKRQYNKVKKQMHLFNEWNTAVGYHLIDVYSTILGETKFRVV